VVDLQKNVEELRLLLSETVALEPEHFESARQTSEHVANEVARWQVYLNVLAQLGLSQWLGERMPEKAIALDHSLPIGVFGKIKLDNFKLSAIATEQILDEVVSFPQQEVASPELATHFYVLVEVLEEQGEVTIRGCLRHDCLSEYLTQNDLPFLHEDCYQLPLSLFETEPHHLLFYCHYLEPSSISLPTAITESAIGLRPRFAIAGTDNLSKNLLKTRTKLSNWLSGIVGEYWQAIEQLADPQVNLALNTRNVGKAVSNGRLINLGMQFGDRTVALIVNVMPEAEAKLRVLAQLYPTGGQKYLPANLKITLRSKAGKILQEVQARSQDNYIQLKPFQGKLGKRFSLEISLLEMSLRKDFEL
jgi:hypothetical protein